MTRRALFARFRGGGEQLRPPWALVEDRFAEACSSCGICIKACPERILSAGHGGLPVLDFSKGACTFCGACAEQCPEHCFVPDRVGRRPWSLVARVSKACVEPKGITCRLCQEACDASAIRFRPSLGGGASVLVSEEACPGCGACVRICPVSAIAIGVPHRQEVSA